MNIPKDTHGKPYALVSKISAGDNVTVDDGFTCMRNGERKLVQIDERARLYITCDAGMHILDGQIETRCGVIKCQPFYLGIYKCT